MCYNISMIIQIDKILTLNEYINAERANKYAAASLKKKYTEYFANVFNGCEKITKPIDIHFIWHLNNKRRDLDGISSIMRKFILDGMVESGILENDNLKWVQGFQDDVKFIKGDIEAVEIGFKENT